MLSFTDLTVPLAGIPIAIGRTYDTLNANTSGDFGHGWRLDVSDVQLFPIVSQFDVSNNNYPAFAYNLSSGRGTRIYVTTADGQREGFTFAPRLIPSQYNEFTNYYEPYFQPDPGVYDTLTVKQYDAENDRIELVQNSDGTWSDSVGDPYNPANPDFGGIYTLTRKDGTVLTINGQTGKLETMTDRNGNTLTFSDSGITSSTGVGITYSRDAQGRITAITDPSGRQIQYQYSAAGDLTGVTDRDGQKTTLSYYTNFPHYLHTIVNPQGVTAVTVTYGTTVGDPYYGRLISLTDALGNPISLTNDNDPNNLSQTVTDQMGNKTTYHYDPAGNVTEQDNPDDTIIKRTYDPNTNNLLSETDPYNPNINTDPQYTRTFAYDDNGNQTAQTDELGNTSHTFYNSMNEPLTQTDPLGHATSFQYSYTGNLVGTTDSLNNTTTNNYDNKGDLLSTTDAQGHTIGTFAYDGSGRLTSSTNAAGFTQNFTYDSNGNQIGTNYTWSGPNDPNHPVTTATTYDDNGQATSSTDENGNTSTTQYDGAGQPTATTEPGVSGSTTYLYDAAEHVVKTTAPDGTITQTVYDADGRATFTGDAFVPGGANDPPHITYSHYDTMGRVDKTQRWANVYINMKTVNGQPSTVAQVYDGTQYIDFDPTNPSQYNTLPQTDQPVLLSTTSTKYNDLGQVVSSTDAANQTTSYQYDADGRQTTVTDPLGDTTTTKYDQDGRQQTTKDALGHVTQYFYDDLGRLIKTLYADGTYNTETYNELGQEASATDQAGRTTQDTYNISGQLTSVILPAVTDPNSGKMVNPTTTYGYDQYGNLTSITDANNHTTTFTFDQFNRQVSRTLPLGQKESTTYDSLGREATHTDFAGQEETFTYDSLGRLQEKQFYAAGATTAGETVDYHFDSLGRNDTVTDTIGSNQRVTSYTFDADNRVTAITTPEGTINYVYDPATGYHTEIYSNNSDTNYSYDALGRLQTVTVTKQNGTTLSTPLVTNYYYTAVGAMDHVTYPNGTETDYGYDTLNRLTSVTNKLGSTVLSSYTYTLDPTGLRTGVTEQELESDGTTSTVTKTWSYDALQRLTQEAVTVNGSAGYSSYTDTYNFDLVGNRLSKTDVYGSQTLVSNYNYNANDELTSETGTLNGASNYATTYQYDDNGSLLNVSRTGAVAENDSYTYDLQNRLSTANITRTENSQAVQIAASYSYDDSGYRAESIVTTTIGTNAPTTTTTQYVVDTMNPTGFTQVLEEHTNGSTTPSMSYLVGLSVIGQTDASSNTKYFLTDAQGSTRLLVDASGTVSARLAYDAYGNVIGIVVGVVSPPPTQIMYTGQLFDPILQQYELRARIYDPMTGQLTSLDPFFGNLHNPLSLNKYLYAEADPVNGFDPTGLSFENDWSLQGIIADWAFRLWAKLQRPWTTPGDTLGTLMPALFPSGSAEAKLKPDLLDTRSHEYFDLKPVRHKTNSDLQREDIKQMKDYDKALRPHGYDRGDSFHLVPQQPGGLPIGEISTPLSTYTVLLWPADAVMQPSGLSGKGLVWYEVRRLNHEPPIIPPVAVERTEKYQGERISIRIWQPEYDNVAVAALTITALVGLGIAANNAGWSLRLGGAFTTALLGF